LLMASSVARRTRAADAKFLRVRSTIVVNRSMSVSADRKLCLVNPSMYTGCDVFIVARSPVRSKEHEIREDLDARRPLSIRFTSSSFSTPASASIFCCSVVRAIFRSKTIRSTPCLGELICNSPVPVFTRIEKRLSGSAVIASTRND
jgi:hypothetical protein